MKPQYSKAQLKKQRSCGAHTLDKNLLCGSLLYQQRAENPLWREKKKKAEQVPKKQLREGSNFKALWGFSADYYTFGFKGAKKKNPEKIQKPSRDGGKMSRLRAAHTRRHAPPSRVIEV